MRLLILNFTAIGCLATAVAVHAQSAQGMGQGGQAGPGRAAMDKVATALGVGQEDMRRCLPRPERGAGRPSAQERKAVEVKALSCLQSVNPDLTQAQFNSAMEQMPRPGGKRG